MRSRSTEGCNDRVQNTCEWKRVREVFLDANLYICAALYSISTIIFFTTFAKAERRASKEH